MMNWRVLLLSLMASLHLNLLAECWTDPATGISWTYTLSDDGTITLGGGNRFSIAIPTSYAGPLTIPATLNGSPVVALNNYAFYNCSALTSVVIPEGVTTIGVYAFYNCSSLTSVVIPEGVTYIGTETFYNCSALTSAVIPEGVTAIWDRAFYNCSALTSVDIPESVTAIGSDAFYNCSALTSIVIPSSVTAIGIYAFRNCSALTSVVIPEGVTAIGDFTFYHCSALTSVIIPEGVTAIGDFAFDSCSALTSVVIPSSVTTIGNSAFNWCSSLTSVVIPEGVTSIEASAFRDCSALTSVEIPEGVTSIGDSAFRDCSALTSVVIPASVTTIESCVFSGCSALTSVAIPEGVTSIGGEAFAGCTSVKTLSIAATVSAMPVNALPSFNLLESIRVAEGSPLYWTENNILYNAGKTVLYRVAAKGVVGEVVIPEGVTYIGDFTFYNCSALTSVVIPEGVTAIGNRAFQGCSALTSVVIPKGVTTIGVYAFYNCSSLTSVVIPEGVTTIESGTFQGCSALTSVVIPEGVTTIESGAFRDTQCKLVFLGRLPREGLSEIRVSPWGDRIVYPEEYAAEWEHALQVAQYAVGSSTQAAVTVRAEMTTPKTMKVTYQVSSGFSRAKVRAVAWKDGVRSFANIVPVRTAAENSPETVPNGGEVAAGVEHTFIWQVSADWNIDLAKVSVEVLAEDAGLLPQDLVTIPATEAHAKMTFTVNTPTTAQLFNALVWYYADGDPALTVSNGVVKINGTQVASGTSLTAYKCDNTALLNYLYGKMGYKVLTGADLIYALEATEIESAKSGLNQMSVKISEE